MLQKTPQKQRKAEQEQITIINEALQKKQRKAEAKPPSVAVPATKKVTIAPVKWEVATILIKGTAPYLQNRFAQYKRDEMVEKQKAGSSQARTRRAKPPKDFQKLYEGSMHIAEAGWHGIPASSFRHALIDCCRLTEMDMVRAKMCLFVVADGLDRENLEPLVRIEGTPRMFLDRVRIGINQTDIVPRAMFQNWSAKVTLKWDAGVFTATDVINLLARAGGQCGIGAGRPFSKTSPGTGKGTWEVVE